MALIVELGAIVGDAEFLNAANCARVLDGDGGVVSDRSQKELIMLVNLQVDSHQLNYPEDAVDGANGQADHRAESLDISGVDRRSHQSGGRGEDRR